MPTVADAPDYGAALLAAREVLDHPDEALSVRRLRGGVTVIRWDAGQAWMEVGLERAPFALLTDDERARIAVIAEGEGRG